MSDNPRERFIRVIPGRIRIEVIGLKRNPIVASALLSRFQSLPGIRSVNPSLETGRVLIYYDMTQIGLGQMAQEIIHIEKMYSLSKYNVEQISHEHQVAATLDNTQNASPRSVESIAQKEPALTPYPTPKMMIPASNRHSTIPAGLAISVTGAALLGIRQLVLGKSAFAGSPLLFTASALISIISGYPFIRRQFHHAANTARANPNFILGASALALALLRENVIVLASISLIELLKWKRSKNPNLVNEPIRIPQEIKEYSEKTSRQSMITAGAAWALTKNPYVGLAVLLAGNPRVASVPAEYTWSQASLTARQQGLLIPHHTSLPELSRINTVVLEDTTLITNKQESEILCAANKHHEAKVWHFAASIMKKINHPWKDGVVTKAKTYPGTIRAAFKVQTTAEGYHAIIHGDEVILGNLQYLRKNHVDCDHYVIEIKRWERQGYEVICLAKNNQYAGCLRKQTGELEQRTVTALQKLQHHNIKVKALNNSLNMHESYLSNYGISLLEPSDKFKLITKEKSSENLLLITNQNLSSSSELGNPRILSLNEVSELQKTIQYARRVDQLANQNFWVAKIWNRVGTMLSVINFLAAPIVNLVGDYFTLLLLARSKRTIEKTLSAKSLSEEINCLETQKQSLLPRGTQPWHTFSTEELLRQFSVHEQYGLPQEKVALLKSQYGPNQLEQKQSPPWLFSYLSQFKEFTTLVVMGTSLLALLTGEIFDGLAMGSILLINAGIGTFQERKADKVIDALNEFQPPKCKVIRDGIQTEIAGNELVPGDIISLGAGDRVPADLRLLRAWNLEANEAALTGESLPVEKSPDVLAEPCSLADCKKHAFPGNGYYTWKRPGACSRYRDEHGDRLSHVFDEDTRKNSNPAPRKSYWHK